MEERKRIDEKVSDLGKYYAETDGNKVYFTYEYPIDTMILVGKIAETYHKNGSALVINDDKEKDIISKIGSTYDTYISIEDSPKFLGDMYERVKVMQDFGIFSKEDDIFEILEGFLGVAVEKDNTILAWKWYKCYTDWYKNDILDYVCDEYKSDFVRNIGMMEILAYKELTTKDYFQALEMIMDVASNTKEKHTYIFQDTTGLYMVGHSKEVPERFKAIKQGNTTLKVIAELNGDFVKEIYKDYSDKKVQGIWFELNDDDLNNIKKLNLK